MQLSSLWPSWPRREQLKLKKYRSEYFTAHWHHTGIGFVSELMECAGNPSACDKSGRRTHRAIGYGQNMVGHGYQIIHGVGRLSITAVEFMWLTMGGFGLRAMSGLRHGFNGDGEADIAAGPRYLLDFTSGSMLLSGPTTVTSESDHAAGISSAPMTSECIATISSTETTFRA